MSIYNVVRNSVFFAVFVGCTFSAVAQDKIVNKNLAKEKMTNIKPKIQEGKATEAQLAELQDLLKDMDPSTYRLEIQKPNSKSVVLGSANLRSLQVVRAVHAKGARPSAADEIATTVKNYVKVVWTSSEFKADAKTRVAKVDALLNQMSGIR